MLDLQTELHEHGQSYQEIYEAVVELKRRHDLHPCSMRPRDGLALRVDGERERVQDLVSRFRKLPEDTRKRMPALLNSLAQLEIVIGDMEAGLGDFQEVTRMVSDPFSRAEAHHNVYCTALERREFEVSLAELRRAVALEPDLFQPFPFTKYEPRKILGVGAFGPSFLCNDVQNGREVVVRSLRSDTLDRPLDVVLRECKWVQELDHPALIRIWEVGQCGPEEDEGAAYVVSEYFPGLTLGEFIAQNGALSPEDWMEIGWPIARALQALHNRGVLHRNLRPGCVLLRKGKGGDGRNRLIVKVLDSALGLKRSAVHASASNPDTYSQTSLGRSVARALAFMPPEVVGRPKGHVWVGPHSDLYSFGRLCAAGLTGRPDPDNADKMLLPEAWQKMLEECLSWTINNRPTHAGSVLDALAKLTDADKIIARIERDLYEETVLDLTRMLEADGEDHTARSNRAMAYYRQGEFAKAILDLNILIQKAAQRGQTTEVKKDPTGSLTPEHSPLSPADLYRRRAQAHARLQDADKAIADYTEVLNREPKDLEALGNRGLNFGTKGEYEKAIADYTAGLRLAPKDEVLYYNRGNAHSAMEDYSAALYDYTETLRINSRHTWALGNRGKVHALLGDLGKALTDFNRLLQLDPNNFRGLCDRAAAFIQLGHIERAIADYTEAIRLDKNAGLFHDRATAKLRLGDTEGAVTDLTEALALSPNNSALLLARARAYAQAGKHDEALADFDDAVESAPQSSVALAQRAAHYSKLGRHQEAVADLTKALQFAPNSVNLLFDRGLALGEMGDYDRSLADFTEVIRIDPESLPAWANRGTSYQRLGEYEQAMADYSEALKLDPDDVLTLINRAGLWTRLRQIEKAIADYTEVIGIDPTHAQALASRGLLYADRGDHDTALADLDAAVRLQPKNPRVYNHRGHVHAQRGESARAVADLTEATKLDPNYALAWHNLGLALSEQGEHNDAINAYSRAIELAPTNAPALHARALARLALGEDDSALDDFTLALSFDPMLFAARFSRAELLRKRGDLPGALAEFDELLSRNPDFVAAYLSRGRVHSQMGQYASAIRDNQEALARRPDDRRVMNNLAWLWATSPNEADRDPLKAVEFARKACEDNEDAGQLDTLAAALASAGEFAEASKVQMRAFELAGVDEKDDFLTRLVLYRAGMPYVDVRG